MANLISVLETLLGYPAEVIIKGFKDLRSYHKPYRNIWMLSLGGVGSILGGIIPTLLAPEVGLWLKDVFETIFPITSTPSYLGGNLIFIYMSLTFGLLVGKWTAQGYFYLRYHDSNSSHLLYPSELKHLIKLYQDLNPDKVQLRDQITRIFFHLVHKIKQVKQPAQGNPIEPLSLEWTKEQLKGVLQEFRTGNSDPYEFYVRLANSKERFTELRLQERIEALDQLMIEELAPVPAMREPIHVHSQSVSDIFSFRLPQARPPTHQARASISVQEVRSKHPKLGRYLTQWSEAQGTSHQRIKNMEEIRQVKEVLVKEQQKNKKILKEIPVPLNPGELNEFRSPPTFNRTLS